MVSQTVSGQDDTPIWNPSKFSLWSQRLVDPNDEHPTSVLLRHPTTPFLQVVDRVDDGTMQKLAFSYLSRANSLPDIDPPLGLPER